MGSKLIDYVAELQNSQNFRTSVKMIAKHYAAHLKDMIDTSLVNVRKVKKVAE